MRPPRILTLLACVPAIALGACSTPSVTDIAAGQPVISEPDASGAETGGPGASGGQDSADGGDMAQIGASYAAALADNGLPVPPASNYATLAQIARGICSQLAAGTSDAEIRAQLEPFSQFAVSESQGQLVAAKAGQAYLDAARTHIC